MMLNRRNIFTVAGAVALAGVPIMASAAPAPVLISEPEQFLAWERECNDCWFKADSSGLSDDEARHWADRAHEFEGRIHTTPATCREAALVKARLLRRFREYDLDPHGMEMVDQLIAFIGRAS